jgi:hypothetical protein
MLTSWSGSSEKGEEGTRNKLCLSMAHSQWPTSLQLGIAPKVSITFQIMS